MWLSKFVNRDGDWSHSLERTHTDALSELGARVSSNGRWHMLWKTDMRTSKVMRSLDVMKLTVDMAYRMDHCDGIGLTLNFDNGKLKIKHAKFDNAAVFEVVVPSYAPYELMLDGLERWFDATYAGAEECRGSFAELRLFLSSSLGFENQPPSFIPSDDPDFGIDLPGLTDPDLPG